MIGSRRQDDWQKPLHLIVKELLRREIFSLPGQMFEDRWHCRSSAALSVLCCHLKLARGCCDSVPKRMHEPFQNYTTSRTNSSQKPPNLLQERVASASERCRVDQGRAA